MATVVTAESIRRQQVSSGRTAFLLLLAFFVPALALAVTLPPMAAVVAFLSAVLLVAWMWQAPIRGVYLLVGGAVAIEVFPLGFSDSVTDRIPFFLNLTTSGLVSDFPVTPAEILMVTAVGIWLARDIAAHRLRLPSGRLVVPYGFFLLVVASAEVHGLAAGGNFKISLWELRPQVYGFVMFVLATSLITERRQVQRVAVVVVAAIAVKALVGAFRYGYTLHRSINGVDAILGHEDSYFLALGLIALAVALFKSDNRRIVAAFLLLAPVALITLVANERRVGLLALGAGVAAIVLLMVRFGPGLRRRALLGTAAGLMVFGVFATSYWNHPYGMSGQLLRPLKAMVGDTSARDYASDQYRIAENTDILAGFQTSPILGMGFGRPMPAVAPLADISQIYPFWNYIPHNTILWIGMRMGMIGFVAFWGLIGMALLEGTHQAWSRRSRLLCGVAAFSTAAIVAELIVAYGDIQLESPRNLIFLGAVLGVLNRMPEMADA